MPSVFSPLAKALLDGFNEGVVVFDQHGRIVYLNAHAREVLHDAGLDATSEKDDLLPELAGLGGRLAPLKVGHLDIGEAIFIPRREDHSEHQKQKTQPVLPAGHHVDEILCGLHHFLAVQPLEVFRKCAGQHPANTNGKGSCVVHDFAP
jgi:hypothetical protein